MIPDLPMHVTHRGNRREDVFFDDEDRSVYLEWLSEYAGRYGMEVWAYCLMSNHVHLLVVGREEVSVSRAIGSAHTRYARWQNAKLGWSGHLWANRFF